MADWRRGTLANSFTLLRLVLVAPIVVAIVEDSAVLALGLLVVAALSDAVDGHLARRFGTTVLGSWLDVTADRVLIAAVLAALWWTGGLPAWTVLVLVAREAAIGAGALLLYAPRRPMAPLFAGKLHTAAAFTLLVVAVAAEGDLLPTVAVDLLAALVLVTAVVSVAAYAWNLRR